MSSKKKNIRISFRDEVFYRDGSKCKVCNSAYKLDAHHITDRNEMPNGGYVKENGISLCAICHLKAEEWHISNHTKYSEGYHPDDLYKMINSSKERAIKIAKTFK